MNQIGSFVKSASIAKGWSRLCFRSVAVVAFLTLPLSGCATNNRVDSVSSVNQPTVSSADSDAVNRRALFEQGVEYKTFLPSVSRRQAMWLRNSAKGSVPEEYVERVETAGGKSPSQLHILAVAEDGCSDSANIIPYLARFVDKVDHLDMRIVDSRVGREVMESHKTPDGRPATPTIVVLDSDYRELGCLIERPKELQTWAMKSKSELSGSEFMKQKFAWYDADLGKQSMADIVEVIEGATVNGGMLLVNCGAED